MSVALLVSEIELSSVDATDDTPVAGNPVPDGVEVIVAESDPSLPSVVTGTGTAVVPSVPVDVLSVYVGSLAEVNGTGTTVGPEEPVTVVDVNASPEVVCTGTGTTEVPSGPDTVLEV